MRLFGSCFAVAICLVSEGFAWSQGKAEARPPVLEITADTQLDPQREYGPILIRKSGVTVDGQGAFLVGAKSGKPKDFKGNGILIEGAKDVVIKNVKAKGFETGLVARNCSNLLVEGCDFSDNFHDPEFGWGESGRRGGIVFDRVTKSTIRKNKANRVWDACVLLNANDNLVEGNDFSRASNTCLKLWTACGNKIVGNNLSYGIRIKPNEVHARDSTSVLMESGSNHNQLVRNDCTQGGDGIFIRVLNGWCSVGNYFEENDCSYANNNAIECWAPDNVFVRNKANHSSYGFWMGGSDHSRLIDNEASFNGLPTGQHNSPHLPEKGHAGIVFMFGSSTHTLVRGNKCEGNNGAGIALIGDQGSKGKKWRAYHWVLENNSLVKNRWGIYAQHADWIVASGNRYQANTDRDVFLESDVNHFAESTQPLSGNIQPPVAKVTGPISVRVGQNATWSADASTDPGSRPLQFTWDKVDGKKLAGSRLTQSFNRPGFQRVSLNVSNGVFTEPAWRDVYVVRDVQELGTEGNSRDWAIEDCNGRQPAGQQTSRAKWTDESECLVGKSALGVEINPYAGGRALLTYPKGRDAKWDLTGKTKISFWLKAINEDVTGWQGGPFLVLHGPNGEKTYIEPKKGRDLMRETDYSEAREGWRLFEVPLQGDDRWQVEGKLPATATGLSLGFDSWGAPALRLWLDGLALE